MQLRQSYPIIIAILALLVVAYLSTSCASTTQSYAVKNQRLPPVPAWIMESPQALPTISY